MLAVFLCLSAASLAKVPTRQDLPRDAGKKLYQEGCWQCHGERGLGDGPLSAHIPSPPLAGRVARPDFDAHVALILGGQGAMPAFSPVLNVTDSRNILLWLEGLDATTGLDPSIPPADEEEEPAEDDADPSDEDG